ncbi:kinase-like domain-containing protein [Syncephalis pseudoplumigaleata]|uniref:Kinase-like domain-containing protein n=1 Tax=Syncephalis pseudoplumigaleata TaxID=1712513 RepID=A0A4P9Z6K2_9FUNG|nr:kinase-like domain-containing protein [Syncephalis pseudoplumigaleata]|eukprot:RKP27792.1 kinase-like domain-containing protein [Syncephalis pseudoplumigaleata]
MLARSTYLLFAALCLPFCAAFCASPFPVHILSVMSTPTTTDEFYVELPRCWAYLTSNEKNGMAGWVEAIDAASHAGTDKGLTVGTAPDCARHLALDGVEGVYFEVTLNKALPVLRANGDSIVLHGQYGVVDTCHLVLPGCSVLFVVHLLEQMQAVEVEDAEYSELLGDQYIITNKQLGRGDFGSVCLAINRRVHQRCAVKLGTARNRHTFNREVEVLATVRGHPRFVQMEHAAATTTAAYLYLQYAWGNMTRYLDVLDLLTEDEAKHIFRQILEGVQHMHHIDWVHRDIKLIIPLLERLPFDASGGPFRYVESIILSDGLNYDGREISDECKDLLCKLLAIDADDRYTIDEALACSWLASPSPAQQQQQLLQSQEQPQPLQLFRNRSWSSSNSNSSNHSTATSEGARHQQRRPCGPLSIVRRKIKKAITKRE